MKELTDKQLAKQRIRATIKLRNVVANMPDSELILKEVDGVLVKMIDKYLEMK